MLLDRIIPRFKLQLLYNNSEYCWLRFHVNTPDRRVPKMSSMVWMQREFTAISCNFTTVVLPVSGNVYEVYFRKLLRTKFEKQLFCKILETLINHIDTSVGSVIFCSELKLFQYNIPLFLSNYVKFTYCYNMCSNIFDPTTYDEIRAMTMYMTYGLLFLKNSNMTNMPTETHGPLVAYTGERPKPAMGKFDHKTVYVNEGTRAMQSVDKCADLGAHSNFTEVILKVRLHEKTQKLMQYIV